MPLYQFNYAPGQATVPDRTELCATPRLRGTREIISEPEGVKRRPGQLLPREPKFQPGRTSSASPNLPLKSELSNLKSSRNALCPFCALAPLRENQPSCREGERPREPKFQRGRTSSATCPERFRGSQASDPQPSTSPFPASCVLPFRVPNWPR